jgi:lactoylglutathione lyase
MTAWPGSISAITLFVDDLAATKAFYLEIFQLPVVFEDEHSAVFRFENTMINLLKSSEAMSLIEPDTVAPSGAGSRLQLTLDVKNVDATCVELTGRGVRLLNGPMNREWGLRTASFHDPGGHIWEIAQPLE